MFEKEYIDPINTWILGFAFVTLLLIWIFDENLVWGEALVYYFVLVLILALFFCSYKIKIIIEVRTLRIVLWIWLIKQTIDIDEMQDLILWEWFIFPGIKYSIFWIKFVIWRQKNFIQFYKWKNKYLISTKDNQEIFRILQEIKKS